MASGSQRTDPYLGYRFLVEIEGLVVGGFSEVTGLQAETEVEEVREGGVNGAVLRLPKATKFPNLVLKRGITDSDALWHWYQEVVDGYVNRQGGAVILWDEEGQEVWRWEFEGAYPVKWVGPDLKADGNAVAIETLELVHNGLKTP